MPHLTSRIHRLLDVATVGAFAVAPSLVPLSGPPAILSYVLAAVHLAVTLATDFPGAARRPLSLRAHGSIEAIVGVALLSAPFLAGWGERARAFYLAAGGLILLVFVLTRFEAGAESPGRGRG